MPELIQVPIKEKIKKVIMNTMIYGGENRLEPRRFSLVALLDVLLLAFEQYVDIIDVEQHNPAIKLRNHARPRLSRCLISARRGYIPSTVGTVN